MRGSWPMRHRWLVGAVVLAAMWSATSAANAGAAALTVTTKTLPAATQGVAYTSALQATGGVPPYHWTIKSGSLPAGLTLSSTGQLTGTASALARTSPTFNVTDSATPTPAAATRTLALLALAPNGQSVVYAANVNVPSITEYAPGATGNAAPMATIAGPATRLADPMGIAVSSSRRLYVANYSPASVTEYAPGAHDNAPTANTISGSATGLDHPDAIALDAAGDVWVANFHSATVTEYAPGAHGNAAPIATIAGAATGLVNPYQLAFDATGNLWVSNFGSNAVTEYAPGANGNAAPIATLGSSVFTRTRGIAFDPLGRLQVADGGDSIFTFAARGAANAVPLSTIKGTATRLNQPTQLAFDPAGRVYTGAFSGNAILGFSFGAAGNVAPAVAIAGPATGLVGPAGVAVSPPARLAVSSSPFLAAHLRTRFSGQLTAAGGVPPYHFSLASGVLPAGLSLAPSGALTGTPTTLGTSIVTIRVTDSALPAPATATRTLTFAVLPPNGQSTVYVANANDSSITEYAPGATGNAAPVATIAGGATQLSDPEGIAVSSSRRLYVASAGSNSVVEFAPDSNGNATPAAILAGPATGLNGVTDVALDSAGNLWASNFDTGAVEEFAPGANGDAAPIATLAGTATGLVSPYQVAFDAAGHLWVADNGAGTVTEYAPGAHGNTAPIATLRSSAFGAVHGLGVDPLGQLRVADGDRNAIYSFAPGASGGAAPLSTIVGAATLLNQPTKLALDPAGRVFAADISANSVLGFDVNAAGDAAPALALAGPATGLVSPVAVAVSPPPPLTVSSSSLPNGPVGAPYSASLAATGGVPPYRWVLTAGALPTGLSLSSTGAVTGTPTATGTATFTVRVRDSAVPAPHSASRMLTVSITIAPGVYAANTGGNSVTEYPLSASGDTPPALAISGPDTGLSAPDSVILDATGRTYVANSGTGTVTEYPVGSTGDIDPLVTITGIPSPRALALDGAGDLFVATTGGPIYEYAPGATGPATPIATITGQSNPEGLAFDANGNLYVSEQQINAITEYSLGVGLPATPINTIAGGDTGLASPQSLVVDPTGDLTVANAAGPTVTVYGPGATGDARPQTTLSSGLQSPAGVDRGTDLTVFVGDGGQNAIVEYAPGASTPTATITGPDTGLGGPISVAATPPLSILTTTLPPATRGEPYLANLQAGEGTTPYRWRLLGGRLPRGLTLTAAGAIVGVPRGHRRRYRFTVKVSDASNPGQSAVQVLTLRVRRA